MRNATMKSLRQSLLSKILKSMETHWLKSMNLKKLRLLIKKLINNEMIMKGL